MKAKITHLHLTQLFRQRNPIDGNILSRVRTASQTPEDLKRLNEKVVDRAPYGAVVICETNKAVLAINHSSLNKASGELLEWEEDRTGTGRKKNKYGGWQVKSIYAPTVRLKKGCRVIIKRNGKCKVDKIEADYYNGDSGVFLGMEKEKLVIERDDGRILLIPKFKAQDIKYVKTMEEMVDEEGNEEMRPVIKAEKMGVVAQYPVTLGYSQTYHSCQGQTYASGVHLMLGKGRPFLPNMFYTGVSRVTTLDKFSVNRHITDSDIWSTQKDEKRHNQQGELGI